MPWSKQSIIVAKTHAKDRDEAKGIAKGFADRLYTSRETSSSYRFRQAPPSKFVEGSYRTKSIPEKGVSIVYGRLKEAGALGTTDNELNEPFTPPGSSFAPSNAGELKRNRPLVPPVSMDTQEGSPTGFRKEAWEGFGDEVSPPGSSFRPTEGKKLPLNDVGPDQIPPVAYEPQNLNSFYTGFDKKAALNRAQQALKVVKAIKPIEGVVKMARERGMIEHKGKTIPAEVKSLADRIREKEPNKSDEYAYRTAWDIFRSYTSEGKKYPHKSPESGLAREGGGTGQIKKGLEMTKSAFEIGFEKRAMLADTHIGNAVSDAIIGGVVPFGTTIGTAAGSRPKGHSRAKEWVGRVGGAVLGSVGGAIAGGPVGAHLGHMAGEGIGSYLTTSHLYDPSGRLKPSVRKEMRHS